MRLKFTKMQACGNDFIVLDDRDRRFAGRETALARRLCQRRFAVGADGLLLLREGSADGADGATVDVARFGMVFVNADGLPGEMCGNGARCLAAYLRRAGLARDALRLTTLAGEVCVRFCADGRIMLALPAPGTPRFDAVLAWQGRDWRFDCIDTGVPHAVCFVEDRQALAAVPVAGLGRHARHHPLFQPRGANINFVAREKTRLFLRTYERGVEAETLGCGTGAAAAALLAHCRFGLPSPLTVETSSGEALDIRFQPDLSGLQLLGDAHFVADGVLAPGFLDDPDVLH